jgi:hypothetical protein
MISAWHTLLLFLADDLKEWDPSFRYFTALKLNLVGRLNYQGSSSVFGRYQDALVYFP